MPRPLSALHTHKEGIVYSPNKSEGLECYIDADYADRWTQAGMDDADNCYNVTNRCHDHVCKLPYLLVKGVTKEDCPECIWDDDG